MPKSKKLQHDCRIPKSRGGSVQLSKNFKKNNSYITTIREWTTISKNNPVTRYHFRSTKSIEDEKMRHTQSIYWFTIHPYSSFSYIWMQIMILVFLVTVPVAFYSNFYTLNQSLFVDYNFYFITFLNIFNILHIAVSFLTGYPKQSEEFEMTRTSQLEIVLDRRLIARKYIMSYFIIDFLAIIHMILEILNLKADTSSTVDIRRVLKQSQSTIDYIQLPLQSFRLLRYRTVLQYLEIMLLNMKHRNIIYKLLRCLLLMFSMVFFPACYAILIPLQVDEILGTGRHTFREFVDNMYLANNNTKPSMDVLFMHSLNEILIAITSPSVAHRKETLEEMILFTIVFLFGIIAKLLILITFINTLGELYSPSLKYRAFEKEIKLFLRINEVETDKYYEVKEYFADIMGYKYFNEHDLLRNFPGSKRYEVFTEASMNLITQCKLFADMPEDLATLLALKLKFECLMAGKKIIEAGYVATCMYFISSGTVAVYAENGRELCHLSDGEYFGEIALLQHGHKYRTADVVAVEFCKLYKLNKEDFLDILKNDKNLYLKIVAEASIRVAETFQYTEGS